MVALVFSLGDLDEMNKMITCLAAVLFALGSLGCGSTTKKKTELVPWAGLTETEKKAAIQNCESPTKAVREVLAWPVEKHIKGDGEEITRIEMRANPQGIAEFAIVTYVPAKVGVVPAIVSYTGRTFFDYHALKASRDMTVGMTADFDPFILATGRYFCNYY